MGSKITGFFYGIFKKIRNFFAEIKKKTENAVEITCVFEILINILDFVVFGVMSIEFSGFLIRLFYL